MADSEKYFTKTVDGQLSVATVAQSGEIIPEESRPGEKYTTALVQTDDGPQLCVKTYDLNGGGGGGGGTVDQTYDPTSTNAQSGTAVAEAVQPALKNTANGVSSLTILGTANNSQYQINIGPSSVGGKNTVSIGQGATAHLNENCVLVGQLADSSRNGGIAIGRCAKVTAFNAIQLGTINGAITTNSTANSFQVFSYQMLDGTTGLIPPERLGTGYDATKTQVLKHVNGVLTWVDEA